MENCNWHVEKVIATKEKYCTVGLGRLQAISIGNKVQLQLWKLKANQSAIYCSKLLHFYLINYLFLNLQVVVAI